MANMMDYLKWRGDLPLAVSPWNEVDSLIMAAFSYNPLPGEEVRGSEGRTLRELAALSDLAEREGNLYFHQWRALFFAMADTVRYGDMRLHDYVEDIAEDKQFSAVAADLSDGSTFLAFRGTDNSLVGWKEDFHMSYESPVPAQSAAVEYLERLAGCGRPLRLSGHSKGGNLAAYAAVEARPLVQDQLLSVCSFDGPGLPDELLNSVAYARIRSRILSVVPQTSVVGMLMGYHPDYLVVHSDKTGIYQHDAFSWHIEGPGAFCLEEDVDVQSRILCEGVHAWLKDCTPEEREEFVGAMFDMAEATEARTTAEISEKKLQSAAAMLTALRKMEPETRKLFFDLIGRMVGDTSSAAWSFFSRRATEAFGRLPFARKDDKNDQPEEPAHA